jgi:predicted nucleic acid-binding protein
LIIIDASALLEILLRTPRADSLMARALDPTERLHAPHLLDIEIAQVLRRLVQRKELILSRAEQAFEDLSAIVVERHEHRPLVPRIWQLRDAMTAYDGAYIALAEALDAPLLTCDGKLAGASGHHAKIEWVAN